MQHRLLVAPVRPRDGIVPIVGIVALAWLIVLALALNGGAVIHHAQLIQGGLPLWAATLYFMAGWQVMLWAMMIPASVHAIEVAGGPRTKSLFVSGYLTIWTGFGLLAFFCDVGLHATVAHSPWLAYHPWLIAGGTLVLAGSYQLSKLKERSLAACRSLGPIQRLPTADHAPSALAGIRYGAQCVGSSGALMLVAFALGAGSLALMAGITAFMVWEVSPWGMSTARVAGYGLILAGAFVLAGPIQGLPLWVG